MQRALIFLLISLFLTVSHISLYILYLFIQNTLHVADQIKNGGVKIRGVNLGSWLVAERWMTNDPSFKIWIGSPDQVGEYQAMQNLSDGDTDFQNFRYKWIQESDIKSIHDSGINSVRVPVGYWIAGNAITSNDETWKNYASGGLTQLDNVVRWGTNQGVAVLISIHGAKGSQNGIDHSAPEQLGQAKWDTNNDNIENTKSFFKFLYDRYKNDASFLGVTLLNEPKDQDYWDLKGYYDYAVNYVRQQNGDSKTILTIMANLGFDKPGIGWNMEDFYLNDSNVLMEWHKYLCFDQNFKSMSTNDVITKGPQDIKEEIDAWSGSEIIIGEWSFATSQNLNDNELNTLINNYVNALKDNHWFYWTWKSYYDKPGQNVVNNWSMRNVIERKGKFWGNN